MHKYILHSCWFCLGDGLQLVQIIFFSLYSFCSTTLSCVSSCYSPSWMEVPKSVFALSDQTRAKFSCQHMAATSLGSVSCKAIMKGPISHIPHLWCKVQSFLIKGFLPEYVARGFQQQPREQTSWTTQFFCSTENYWCVSREKSNVSSPRALGLSKHLIFSAKFEGLKIYLLHCLSLSCRERKSLQTEPYLHVYIKTGNLMVLKAESL